LDAIGHIRVATAPQLSRIAFSDASRDTADRLAHRCLQRLAKVGLVRRFPNISQISTGPPGFIHVLTPKGLQLTGRVSSPGASQRKTWHPGPTKLAHWLAIGDLYVRLAEASRQNGSSVLEFSVEADAKREYQDDAGRTRLLRPDALVRLYFGGQELSWFIEVDRGTQGLRVIDHKCRAYRAYELTDIEFQHHGVFPGVLFVTLDDHRTQNIARVIAAQPAEARGLFRVVSSAEAPAALLKP
jgi:hypothetical protein